MKRLPFIALLAAYMGLTLWVTLRARPGQSSDVFVVPFVDTWNQMRDLGEKAALQEVTGNVLLFLPLGYLAPASFRFLREWWVTVVAGALLSVLIELSQWLFGVGRSPSIDDVIYNTVGAAIGAAVFFLLTGWRRYRRDRAGRERAQSSAT